MSQDLNPLDELSRQISEAIDKKLLRLEHPYVVDLVRVLEPHSPRGIARQEVLRTLETIRAMIGREGMPGPTPVRARCRDCEFRRYCNDVW